MRAGFQTVTAGFKPCERHWKGKLPGRAVPPGAVAIQEAGAPALVTWTLALQSAQQVLGAWWRAGRPG